MRQTFQFSSTALPLAQQNIRSFLLVIRACVSVLLKFSQSSAINIEQIFIERYAKIGILQVN